jgi:hypothetical protein
MSNISYKTSLNDNMLEISKTLDNLKINREKLQQEIENEELYKQKLIEKFKSYTNEANKIIGIIN